MIVFSIVVVILTAGGGSSKDVQIKQQPIDVCLNPARLYPDPDNCRKFLRCVNRKPVSMSCPAKTMFDPVMQICIWREEASSCSSEHHDAKTDKRYLQNLTHTTHDLQKTASETTKSRSVPNKSRLNQSTHSELVASSKQKTGKVEMEISLQKIKEPVNEYNISKPRPAHPKSSSGVRVGSAGKRAHLKHKDVDLSTTTVTAALVKPSIMATHTAAAPLKPSIMATHTAAAPLKPSIMATHTAAPLKPSIMATHTAAPLKSSIMATHTAATPLKPTITATHTAAAPLKPTITATHSAAAQFKPTIMATHTASPVKSSIMAAHTSAPLKPTITATHSAAAPLKPTIMATHTAAPLKPTIMATHTAAAPVKPTITATHTAAAPLKPHIMATHTAVFLDPGNKWYHKMNAAAATAPTPTLSSLRSQTTSAISHQVYQSHQQTGNLKDKPDGKPSNSRMADTDDSFNNKGNPSDAEMLFQGHGRNNRRPDVSEHVKQDSPIDLIESTLNVTNGNSHITKTESNVDDKKGGPEKTQRFKSTSINKVQNSTAETDDSAMFDVVVNGGENHSNSSAWVHNASVDMTGDKKAQQKTAALSPLDDIKLRVQPSAFSNNKTHISNDDIPHLSGNATVQTTETMPILDNNFQDKDVKAHEVAYNGSNLSETENSRTDNSSFDDVAKLIQPYRVRLDRKSNSRAPKNPGDDVDSSSTKHDENRINNKKAWTPDEIKLLPALFEHLTAKIVNRDLLVPEITANLRWYDKQDVADTDIRSNTPTQVNTANTKTSKVEYGQYLTTEKDNLSASNNAVLTTSIEEEDSEARLVKGEHSTPQAYTDTPSPLTNLPSAAGTQTDSNLVSPDESSVDSLSALPVQVTDGVVSASSMSSPYLATGLTRPFRCPEMDGHFPDATNCAVYFQCSRGQANRKDCPPGQVFHASVQSCVPSSLVPPCASTYMDAVQEDEDFARSVCKDPDGLYRDNVSCVHYFECTNGWPIRRQCMMGTVFDDVMRKCSWSKFVPGCEQQTTPEVDIYVSDITHNHFQCPRDGYFRDPHRCDVYYLCAGSQALRMTCDPGTNFDVTLNMCVWSHLVHDCRVKQGQLAGEEQGAVAALAIQKSSTSASAVRDTSMSQQQDFECPEKNGIYPLSQDCGVYYVCADDVARQMSCPEGLGYDLASGVCLERAHLAQCVLSDHSQSKKQNTVPSENTAPFTCPEAHGLYSDTSNCSFFIHCFKKVAYRHECQPGTVFSSGNAACTWSQLVPECQKTGRDKPEVTQNLNRQARAYSKKAHRGVHTEPYQPHMFEPSAYKVRPVGIQEFTCPDVEDGFFRDNVFCDIFHRCVVGKKFTFTCPAGTFFRLQDTLCDFWEAVSDCTKDGIRLEAMGSLPDVVALSQVERVQEQNPEQFELNIVNIDADPIGCPASGGLFPHPRNCRQFVFCSRFVPLVLTCPEPLLFNSQTLTCDFATKVHCFRSNDYGQK